MRRTAFTLMLLLLPANLPGQTIEAIRAEIERDGPHAKCVGQPHELTITVNTRYVQSNGTSLYSTKEAPAGILFHLPKHYRQTDELKVKATLRQGVWDKDAKKIVFDPVVVIEEIKVLPPLWNAEALLKEYLAKPKATAKKWEGKIVHIKGTVLGMDGTALVLCLTPPVLKRDAIGRPVYDPVTKQALLEPQRPLFTVAFADGIAANKNLTNEKGGQGTQIEVQCKISEMNAGVIRATEAKILK